MQKLVLIESSIQSGNFVVQYPSIKTCSPNPKYHFALLSAWSYSQKKMELTVALSVCAYLCYSLNVWILLRNIKHPSCCPDYLQIQVFLLHLAGEMMFIKLDTDCATILMLLNENSVCYSLLCLLSNSVTPFTMKKMNRMQDMLSPAFHPLLSFIRGESHSFAGILLCLW